MKLKWAVLLIMVFSIISCSHVEKAGKIVIDVITSVFNLRKQLCQDPTFSSQNWQLCKSLLEYINQNIVGSRSGSSSGPSIIVTNPKIKEDGFTIEMESPGNLDISFGENPVTHEPADMKTFDIKILNGQESSVSLTEYLKPGIDGNRLNANIDFPEGIFHLQISIADAKGEKRIENYLLEVKKP